jgi:serine/threonine protein kinase/Tol biopolymer transport system component
MIGKTLGHYRVGDQLGRGGMGEVYQAKDLKLGREVAIKVLPEEFAENADRVARFQREAKLLASLNHPNIAAIYGLEEFGGTNFLVLELVEGETLADQIKKGPISVEEALKLALQIAEALEAAHEKSVIHRDLKPANIKVTPDGKVKVLDFGLAKAFAGDQEVNLSNSPTLSNAATQQGVILGTAAYMSPEQASGKTIDKRSDIWAFGVVLFEMLTGRPLFAGDSVTQTLARVLERQPDFLLLPSNLYPKVSELLKRCLQKESKNRYHDIADIRLDLQEVLNDTGGLFVPPISIVEPRRKLGTILPWAAAALVLGLIIAGVAVWKLKPAEPRQVMRFEYELPEGRQLAQYTTSRLINLAISPDGRQFVYGTAEGLYLRSMDSLEARLIAGTDKNSAFPFFSPDGQWIGYWSASDRKLTKVAVSGGTPIILCDAGNVGFVGASWDSTDTIVYSGLAGGVMRISANGGVPESVIKANAAPDAARAGLPLYPQMLPDGKTLLFTNISTNSTGVTGAQIVAQSLESGERKVLVNGGVGGRCLPTGHIVYFLISNNTTNLFAVPFDSDKLETKGGSVSLLEGVGAFAVSGSGTLVYVPRQANVAAASPGRTLVWVDRQGKEDPVGAEPKDYGPLNISPDGTRVALTITTGGNNDVWIRDLARKNTMRLTFSEGSDNAFPVWTPDSKRIVYSCTGGIGDICGKAADGTGEVEKLNTTPGRGLIPFSMSQDGKALAVSETTLSSPGADIGMLSMEGDHPRKLLLQGKHNATYPKISPDGHWLAYQSDESGRYEVYVLPFPDVNGGGRWQVSTTGGNSPLWSPNGRELFYRSGDSFMAVGMETGPVFRPRNPEVLFKGAYDASPAGEVSFWTIHPDGKRFLMLKEAAAADEKSKAEAPRTIVVVLNWLDELKQRVPVK